MKKLFAIIPLSILFLMTGCVTRLTSELAPGANFDELGKTYVVRFEPDKRELNKVIADELTLMGYPASAGEKNEIPNDVDTLVTYKDKWKWDMSNYMLSINIELRDGQTKELIVHGESYRTSMARKAPEDMIQDTLNKIFEKKVTQRTTKTPRADLVIEDTPKTSSDIKSKDESIIQDDPKKNGISTESSTTPNATDYSSAEDRLATLKKLYEQGLISSDDYEKKKSEIISAL